MDDVNPGGVDAEAVDELTAAVLGVDDHGVDALEQAPLGGELARARLAREQVVGGQDERAAGQQGHVEHGRGQPLEMDDVGVRRRPAVAQHVGHVGRELAQAPRARAR